MDDCAWKDVDDWWNAKIFWAVQRGLCISLCRIRYNRLNEQLKDWYWIDCENRSWITQERARTGTRRPMRVVQVVRAANDYMPPGPPPPYPPPDRAQPTGSRQLWL